MTATRVYLHDQALELRHPASLTAHIDFLYRGCLSSPLRAPIAVPDPEGLTPSHQSQQHDIEQRVGLPASAPEGQTPLPGTVIAVDEGEDGRFALSANAWPLASDLGMGDLPTFLMEAVVCGLVKDLRSAVALHAGAVAADGNAVLIAGPTGSGKSSVVAWLAGSGFDYLSDEVALLLPGEAIRGLPRALVLKPGAVENVLALPAYQGARTVPAGQHTMLRPAAPYADCAAPHPCRLMIFPRYVADGDLCIEAISPAQAALRLVEANLNARNLADGGFRALASFARSVPAISLRYGDFAQLDGTADALIRFLLRGDLEAAGARRFLSLLAPAPAAAAQAPEKPKTYPIPAATPRREPRTLTIGMATYDDFDGAYFSVQALRLYHPEVMDDVEIIVVDNHPDGPCSEHLKALETKAPNYRYIPFVSHSGTAVRDQVFAESSGKLVLCIDCHVFVVPGAIRKLLAYYAANPETPDLLQGPIIWDELDKFGTHFHPAWRAGMYGYWETDERGADPDGEPFEIPMQGLGLFSCRRAAWPGFNPAFRGFGGEEGYIHEKFRQRGGRALCLPFLRWLHRFPRPMGVPYAVRWEDRVRNYAIGLAELGLPTEEMWEHFREVVGPGGHDMLGRVRRELERKPERDAA